MQISINALTDEQRLLAKEQARRVVVQGYGAEPTLEQFQRPLPLLPSREDYENRSISEYPAWVTKIIASFMGIVFVAAALPSLFRLYVVGYSYFLEGINNEAMAHIVGFSTFLLAEFLIVLSTVAMRVLFKSAFARAAFIIPIVLGMAMAFVGNWTITQPHDAMSWLETVAPPIAVLFTAFIGEQLILHNLKTRHANERAYQTDYRAIDSERRQQTEAEKLAYRESLHKWHEAINKPEGSDAWLSAYANAIWQQLLIANDSGRGRSERMEYLGTLDRETKIALVRQQIEGEKWFTEKHLSQATQRLQSQEHHHEPENYNGAGILVNPTPALQEPMLSSNGNGAHHPNGKSNLQG
jgi:hypothetical protein